MRPTRPPVRLAIGAVLGLASLLVPATASAHPLGNFSINHYSGLSVGRQSIAVEHVLDLSEIPTFSARAEMDLDADGEVVPREASSWAADACASAADTLRLTQDGSLVQGSVTSSAARFAPGQGASTLRLECGLEWRLGEPLATGGESRFVFRDETYAERIGWREIVVVGDGTSIVSTDALSISTSDRLLSYPPDPFADPADQRSATFTARADATGVGVATALPVDGGVSEGSRGRVTPQGPAGELSALIEADELDGLTLIVALAIAVGLGALHALSPGHGKTVMAAYLVGARGTLRTAVALGLVVTISHTAGVVLLGLLTLGASSVIPVERLYPILGLISGLIVLGIGGHLLWSRLRDHHPALAHADEHRQAHEHEHEHGHAHDHEGDHGHRGDHWHEHEHVKRHEPSDPQGDGSHAHGPFRHRHDLPRRGMGWRGLASLGLAGGMIPSASALILLLGAVAAGRPELGIVLTIAFGAGMALVLSGVGVAVVVGRGAIGRVADARLPSRLAGAVPTVAGALVLTLGIVMTAQAVASLQVLGIG